MTESGALGVSLTAATPDASRPVPGIDDTGTASGEDRIDNAVYRRAVADEEAVLAIGRTLLLVAGVLLLGVFAYVLS
jgi:hypothetical protein